jgi:hypothetical protein
MWKSFKKYFNLGKIGKPEWAGSTCKLQVAIEYCLREIEFYEEWGRHNRRHWKIWQNIAVISGIIATVLAALPNIPNTFFGDALTAGVIRVIPTALTALSATVLGTYNYKGEHIRQGLTHDSLQGELVKFLSAAKPYDDPSEKINLSLFVSNMRAIVAGELAAWRSQFQPQE